MQYVYNNEALEKLKLCIHLVLQVFSHCLSTVVPLQTNHQDLCGGLCGGLGHYSCLCPPVKFLG